ncbi:uncharacterized protein LOC119687119 isoform X2 [Teleopsis dalmanni]|nr:uncharacterized protein LOC119687119 isoform X2 [Teleopsis dalmanni]XP_037957244.1 uncharacterized protein LOC119687119 isoform X2 [Teleopsis dalmanni]XP_037957245.1 uncharacterized protein LOC119687119 isoform X2 [Teleopsis dalmanni]
MVIANNEWLHNCEDGEKSGTTNSTSTTTTTTLTTTSTPTTTTTSTSNSITETPADTISTPTTNTANTVTNTSALPLPVSTTSYNATTETTALSTITNENVIEFLIQQDQELHSARILKAMAKQVGESLNNEVELRANESDNNNWSILNATFLNDTLNKQYGLNSNTNSNTNSLQTNSPRLTKSIESTSAKLSNPTAADELSTTLQSDMSTSGSPNSSNSSDNSQNYNRHINIAFCEPSKSLPVNQLHSSSGSSLSSIISTNSTCNNVVGSDSIGNDNNGNAKIILICEANSHPFETRTIPLTPNIECKVGRLIAKSKASESNAIFDCKVLSRNHAVLWFSADDNKFWVKDTKSSNGTFINDSKLGTEAAELHFGDIVKFGVDVLENSRKEVHGCIIACVKLYLPDGREAISIETSMHRSLHSGETRISYEELHRLNLYIQESVQREKVLKSKLYNIQNVLDATRKSTAQCWQSMISEDQLLHRIQCLEKKVQITEKNLPENVLKSEILKLLDEKTSYQHAAKEALRKVYQERCDAMQMLTKMESTFQSSENEGKLLREQLANGKQALQDVSTRLLNLEAEYSEFKVESEKLLQEAKFEEEIRIADLTEKMTHAEKECTELRRKVCDLLRGEDEDQLQKQAIEKLDAAIADMDLGDDDDDDDDENELSFNEIGKNIDDMVPKSITDLKNICDEKITKLDINESEHVKNGKEESTSQHSISNNEKPAEATESTIMKWLQNSDLNKKAGSLDIFKAICNESDSSDEHEISPARDTICTIDKTSDFQEKCLNFSSKLKNVQDNLKQLEAEIEIEANSVADFIATAYDDNSTTGDDSDDEDDDQYSLQNNGTVNKHKFKHNKGYLLLKKSVKMLREAYNELCDKIVSDEDKHRKSPTPPPAISVQTQFQNYAQHKPSTSAVKRLETQDTLKPLPEIIEDEEDIDHVEDVIHESDIDGEVDLSTDVDEASHTPLSQQSLSSITTLKGSEIALRQKQTDDEIIGYQLKINDLNEKISKIETDTQHMLEIMQFECDKQQDKIDNLIKVNETLVSEKEHLQKQLIVRESSLHETKEVQNATEDENKISLSLNSVNNGTENATDTTEASNINDVTQNIVDNGITAKTINTQNNLDEMNLMQEFEEEKVAINTNAMRQEEELITYKEHLEEMHRYNLLLRKEISDMKQNTIYSPQKLYSKLLPIGVIFIAIILYLVIMYF